MLSLNSGCDSRKLSDSCPYNFPCLMIGRKGTPWEGVVFLMAVNEVDDPDDEPFLNALVIKAKKNRCQIGDNYGFKENTIMPDFEPYHGQVIIHSEQLNPNLI